MGLILMIILTVALIIFGAKAIAYGDDNTSFGGGVFIFLGCVLWTMAILSFIWQCFCIECNFSEQILTGYIYSVEDTIGDATIAHIRFSENAGQDTQPSFCVKKEDGELLKELVGSDTKVSVTVPAGFALLNSPFDCGLPAAVKIIEKKEENENLF